MDISVLSIRDLQAIVVLARERHFGHASLKLHITQPALSAQLKKLETFLGVALFERRKSFFKITKIGANIVAQAEVVLDEVRKLIPLAQGQRLPFQGQLRLGGISSLGPYYFPFLLGPFQSRFPKTQLILKEGLTDNLLEELREGSLDAVLAADTFEDSEFKTYPLFKEAFLLALPKSHPLAAKASLTLQDLRSSEMVLLEDGHCLTDQALELCTPKHRKGSAPFQATSLETLRYLVANGLGYTLMPSLAVTEDKKLKSLILYRPFDNRAVGRRIILVCRKNNSYEEDFPALISLIQETLPTDRNITLK